MSRISIIIPAYNCSNSITNTLNSILKQNIDDIEIIIIDDGSIDNTRTIITSYIQNYPGIIKYFYQDNQGSASARNKGIKESTGEYIAFIDADDLALDNSLRKQKEFLVRNKNVDLVFGDWYINELSKSVLESINFTDYFKDVLKSEESDYISKDDFLTRFLEFSPHPILIGTVMIRRRIIDTIGLFRIDLLNGQDLEFIIRIVKKHKVGYINQPLYRYQQNLSQNSKNFDRYYYFIIKIYEELKVQNISSEINEILRKKISNEYFDFGYGYKERSLLVNARKCLILSINYNPFQIRSYKTLIGTFMPIKLKRISS